MTRITDHFVLRYCERIHGIDMEQIRENIRKVVVTPELIAAQRMGATRYTTDSGIIFVLGESGELVSIIDTNEGDDVARGKKRQNVKRTKKGRIDYRAPETQAAITAEQRRESETLVNERVQARARVYGISEEVAKHRGAESAVYRMLQGMDIKTGQRARAWEAAKQYTDLRHRWLKAIGAPHAGSSGGMRNTPDEDSPEYQDWCDSQKAQWKAFEQSMQSLAIEDRSINPFGVISAIFEKNVEHWKYARQLLCVLNRMAVHFGVDSAREAA